ncbi:MAG: helix-hairpin-helix domain-containing protein [Thermodesulfobacteriota bacterium]|nr:helix-hairpin-helix domain-containing protein [Thermodesulfobacteriota bacterium]
MSMKYLSKDRQLILIFLTVLLIISSLIHKQINIGSDGNLIINKEEVKNYIEVLGEVRNPGIYSFDGRITVYDAIKMAGGLNVDLIIEEPAQYNVIKRGEKLTVQKVSENTWSASLGKMDPHKLIILSIPIDINTAYIEELIAIPKIGPKTASKIVEYRDKKGGFSSLDELLEVKGIRKVQYNRIKKYVYLESRFSD